MAETDIALVFTISLLSFILLAIQAIFNIWEALKRKEREDKRLMFEKQKHKTELEIEKQKYRLEKKQLRQEKYQDFLDYQTRLNEYQLQMYSTMVSLAKEFGIDLTKGDFEGQVQDVVKRATQPQTKERLRAAKEQKRAQRKPK